MSERPEARRLTKREAEELLRAADTATGSALEEILVVVDALRAALVVTLGVESEAVGWAELIEQAARVGRWPATRRRRLLEAGRPSPQAEEEILEALWDLMAELNENRGLSGDGSDLRRG